MIKLEIVIGDYDQKYLQKLSSYFMNYQEHHFTVNTFSEITLLKNHLLNNPIDILLLTEEFYVNLEDRYEITILLVAHAISSTLKSYPCIEKYQNVKKIIQQMMLYYTSASSKELIGNKEGGFARLVGFYSPSGGSGKTTIALALSKALSMQGKKTLFLSLEEITSYSKVIESDRQTSLSDLLYYASKRAENLLMKLEGIVREDISTGLKFVPPPIYAQDMVSYEEDWLYLINYLLRYSDYEWIVLDFTSQISNRNLSLMDKCNKLVVLTNLSYFQNAKAEVFLKMYQDHQNVIVVANLTKPNIEEEVTAIGGLPIQAMLPFVEALYLDCGGKVMMNLEGHFSGPLKTLAEEVSHD